MDSPTNQIFLVLENTQLAALEGKAKFGFWEKFDDTHTVVRIATSWATRMDEVEALSRPDVILRPFRGGITI